MAYNEDSSASGHDEPWIQWFCGLKGHEMFCEVERSYIEDGFNLYGLRACVPNFSDCLDLILDRIGPDDSDDSHLTQSACTLYGLIHARYIITAHGLDAMYNKYAGKEFGTCPLVQCTGQPVLPVGLKDEMGFDTVKIFCPKCQCVYHPPSIRTRSIHHGPVNSIGSSGAVDGAAFGTTFPHLFLMTFSNLVPDPLPIDSAYVPRIFGFRVHQSARQRSLGFGVAAGVSSVAQLGNVANRRGISFLAAGTPPASPASAAGAAAPAPFVTSVGAANSLSATNVAASLGKGGAGDGDIGKTRISTTLGELVQSSLPEQDATLAAADPSEAKSRSSALADEKTNVLGANYKRDGSGNSEVPRKGDGDLRIDVSNKIPARGEEQIISPLKRKTKTPSIGDKGGNGDSTENGSSTSKSKRQKRINNGVS